MKPNKIPEHQKKYIDEAKSKILEHKWLESEKAGRDLGQDAIIDWVKKYAKVHRKEFIDKHLGKAEEALEKLKQNPNIPKEIIETLEAIYDEIDTVKDNMEVSDKDGSGVA